MKYRIIGRFRLAAALAALVVAPAGCGPSIDVHGVLPEQDVVKTIRPGQATKEIVLERLGVPSSKAMFQQDIWFYIGEKTATYAFFSPSIRERKIVAVHFDGQSRVREVKQYGLKDGQDIDFVDKTTPTKGRELTVLQQLLGNIGRFKDPEAQNQGGS